MCLLLESIKIQNKALQNIERHNARLNRSRKELFGVSDFLDLQKFIKIPDDLINGIYKCRIIYSKAIQKIEILPYIQRDIKSLRLVLGDYIEYGYKYLDRTSIERLKENCGADDILIVKNNQITDTSFANVVLFDGKSWTTPAEPLLKGTKRQLLLDSGIIHEEEIRVSDLKHFQKLALINAMLELDKNNFIPIENIWG